jgi:hypothetical protein
VFLCQTTIPSDRDFKTRKHGGDGTSCDAGAKSKAVASLRANPNPLQTALAPRSPEAGGNKVKQSRHHSLREIVTQIRIDHIGTSAKVPRDVSTKLLAAVAESGQLPARQTILVLLGTDNCCYRSGALVTGGLDRLPVAARIDVDGHHHGNVPALYRARFRYQA